MCIRDRKRRSGSDSMMDTPVPIPNTEVKHHNGDDSTAAVSYTHLDVYKRQEEEYGKLSEHSREEERGFRKR